jgi:hypothetical protein
VFDRDSCASARSSVKQSIGAFLTHSLTGIDTYGRWPFTSHGTPRQNSCAGQLVSPSRRSNQQSRSQNSRQPHIGPAKISLRNHPTATILTGIVRHFLAGIDIDIPKRRHQQIRYVDELTRIPGYEGQIRQIAVTGLGRKQPTLFLTNNTDATARELVTNYARRNGIEDALGSSVNFFHQDCLSSEVRLNVDLDTVLTVLANGCYRWLASQLHGFDQSKPKCVYRKFVETSGAVEIESGQRIVVYLDRRSHNPILREANLDKDHPKIPWLGNHRLEFVYS